MACPDEDQLLAFSSGRLAGAAREAVLAHLDGCGDCRSVVSMLGRSSFVQPVASTAPALAASTVSAALAAAVPLSVGSQVGRYFLLRVVGTGAMGVVYEAYDPELKREVALKLILQRLENKDVLDEARAMAALNHPNVVAVYDSGRSGDHVYLVMELVTGQSLRHWLLTPRSTSEIVKVFAQLARGLSAVHEAHLAHRDIKPDNVVLGDDGRPRLVDFGFAFAAEPAGQASQLVGTPRYMAPEVQRGQQGDAASDQYSFCVALAEALDGSLANRREADSTRGEQPATAFKPKALPAHLARLVAKGTSVEAGSRYPTMRELAAELERDPARGRRQLLMAAGVVAVLGVAIGGSAFAVKRQSQVCKGAEAKLIGVWDEGRRAAVEAAFTATGKPYAAKSFAGVAGLLDGYVSAWVTAHTEACMATRVSGEQSEAVLDLRMQCLSSRLDKLRSTVQVLTEPNPALADKAVNIAGELAALAPCSDVERLVAEGPAAMSDEARARSAELSAKVARAAALLEAVRVPEATELLTQALEVAEKDGLERVRAEALELLTRLKSREGTAEVEALSERALLAAESTGVARLVAAGWVTRGAALHRVGKPAEAHAALAHAAATLEHLPTESLLRGHREYTSAAVSIGERKPDLALADAKAAVTAYAQDPAGRRRLPEALKLVAASYNFKGDRTNALDFIGQAIAKQTELYGSSHPSLEGFFNLQGVILTAMDRPSEADAAFNRALEVCEAGQGHDALCVASALNNLAINDLAQGHSREAVDHLSRAAEVYLARLGPSHPDLANTYAQLADARGDLKEYAASIDAAQKSLDIRIKHFEPGAVPIAFGHQNLGEAYLRAGQCAKAEGPLASAVQILDKPGVRPEDRGDGLKDLAEVLFCLKKPAGLVRARAAIKLYESLPNRQGSLADLKFSLAQFLWSQNEKNQAFDEARGALAIHEARSNVEHATEVKQWLAARGRRP